MEVILISPNPKYETLVQSNKIIQSNNVDIVALIETQVFLNHHYNISFYCIKNNFPYQFHCPLKISKHLLDRNQGAVQLSISNGLHFKIQQETDTLDILSNVQSSLQGVESQQNVVFTLKFWEIQIRLCILNEIPQENRIKQAINLIQEKMQEGETNFSPTISKIILYIDDTNYEDFLSWSENQGDFFDFELHQKLSHEYLSLKQEIDNQKNSFRNKIKMVEAILGQNINIDKLLNEQKQQNQEYKRLRQTFQTIKNIDNVLIDQQKKLEFRTNELKQKRAQKHSTQYQNAKIFVKKKAELAQLAKQVEQLRYNVKRVTEVKQKFNSKRNFDCPTKIKEVLQLSINKYRHIVGNMFESSTKKSQNKSQDGKFKSYASLHKSESRKQEEYQNFLKTRVANYQKQDKQQNQLQNTYKNLQAQLKVYEDLLSKVAKFCQKNRQIMIEAKQRLRLVRKSTSDNFESRQECSNISAYANNIWDQQQFVVLNQLHNNKNNYSNYACQNKENTNRNVSGKMDSSMSIKLAVQENKSKNRLSIQNSKKNSMIFDIKSGNTKLTKSKINFTFEQRKTAQCRF